MKYISRIFLAVLISSCSTMQDLPQPLRQTADCMTGILANTTPAAQNVRVSKVKTEYEDRLLIEYFFASAAKGRQRTRLFVTTEKSGGFYQYPLSFDFSAGGPLTEAVDREFEVRCGVKSYLFTP